MADPILGICSMATRALLADLASAFGAETGVRVTFEAVGGVVAAKRVRAGERFDLVVLASAPLRELEAGGFVDAGSTVGLALSSIAAAVPAGRARPDLSTEDALRRATLDATRIAFSTGPSGDQLKRLFQRWGVAETLAERLVQAPAGVPVATLLADGRADLGFQQLSELTGAAGIDILGRLPPGLDTDTVFAGAVGSASADAPTARRFLAFAASPERSDLKRRHGLEPA